MTTLTRRDLVLGSAAAVGAGLGLPYAALAQRTMPTRTIPRTGEALPVIGLGSSKVVQEIPTAGREPVAAVLGTLVELGGKVVDTWPRNADNDAAFGEVTSAPALRERLFVTTKIDRPGKEAGAAQFTETLARYRRETIDLVQVFSLTDLDTHWPNLLEWKTSGQARYVGVTVAEVGLYERLEQFLARERPDFVQLNYSISERQAEERLLALATDRGAAVLVNRPFMNGTYFRQLEGQPVPAWAAEFGCESWAQFSLKYILANPAVTCILTETTKTAHMRENALTASGPVPDAAARQRMRAFIDAL